MSHTTSPANLADVDPACIAPPPAVAQPSLADLDSSADAFRYEVSPRRFYCLALIHLLSAPSLENRPDITPTTP